MYILLLIFFRHKKEAVQTSLSTIFIYFKILSIFKKRLTLIRTILKQLVYTKIC